jgi:hypothetical protein
MKIGLILECRPGGPDADVYKYVAERLCKKFEIDKPKTLIDKKSLIQEAPEVAQTLIADGCQHVFIIWDKKPRWGDGGDCTTDNAALTNGLNQLGVNMNQIKLCCIDEMMESWLIADSRGFMAWIRSKTNHKLPEIGDHKTKAEQTSPKDRIKNYLKANYGKWKYNDYDDNLHIVKNFPDFDRTANRNTSFKFFKESVQLICPN